MFGSTCKAQNNIHSRNFGVLENFGSSVAFSAVQRDFSTGKREVRYTKISPNFLKKN